MGIDRNDGHHDASARRLGLRRYSAGPPPGRPAFALLVALGIGVGSVPPSFATVFASCDPQPTTRSPGPEVPSVFVLPFTARGGAIPSYLRVGLTVELIDSLSQHVGLFVVSGDTERAGVETGAVFAGTLAGTPERLEIEGRLTESGSGAALWAWRTAATSAELMTVPGEISAGIRSALGIALSPGEKRRVTAAHLPDPRAFEAYLRGWTAYRRGKPHGSPGIAAGYRARCELRQGACWPCCCVLAGVEKTMAPLSRYQLARGTAPRAESPSSCPPTPLAYRIAASIRVVRPGLLNPRPESKVEAENRYAVAVAEAENAIAMAPSDAEAHAVSAEVHLFAGRVAEARKSVMCAMRHDRDYPAHFLWLRGMVHFVEGRYLEAASDFEAQLSRDPHASPISLAAAYVHLEREAEARDLIVRFKDEWRRSMTEPPNLGSLNMIYPFRTEADRDGLIGALNKVFWD